MNTETLRLIAAAIAAAILAHKIHHHAFIPSQSGYTLVKEMRFPPME